MNVTRIQQDLIKDVLSGKADNWFIQTTDSEMILFTRHQIYLLDHKDFLLKTGKLVEAGVKDIATANQILKSADDAKPAHKTGKLKIHDKATLLELKIDNSDELVYLDEKLLKYYDKSAEYEASDYKSPVYVYEDDILVGVVLPVKVV